MVARLFELLLLVVGDADLQDDADQPAYLPVLLQAVVRPLPEALPSGRLAQVRPLDMASRGLPSARTARMTWSATSTSGSASPTVFPRCSAAEIPLIRSSAVFTYR